MLFAQQLSQHLDSNDLYGERQSSYRKYHSTVTALVRVTSDILQAIDIHGEVVLILLDLTAAFDVINHELLLQRMEKRYGITGTVLQWFRSYLTGRVKSVNINGTRSDPSPLPEFHKSEFLDLLVSLVLPLHWKTLSNCMMM